jgi:hypothetical protein
MERIAAFFTPGRALAGVLCLLLGSCGVSGEARDRADRAKAVPQGTPVSEGRLNARTFKPALIQERGKHGYLVLRESYLAPEFATLYAAGLGSREDVMATWEEDRKKALSSEQKTVRIQGKPVAVQVARFSQFGNRGRKVHYAWMRVNGVGVKVERNEYQPAHLFERATPESEGWDLEAFREFAESIRVSGS